MIQQIGGMGKSPWASTTLEIAHVPALCTCLHDPAIFYPRISLVILKFNGLKILSLGG